MESNQYVIAGYVDIFYRLFMMSLPIIPPISFCVETRVFYSQKALDCL